MASDADKKVANLKQACDQAYRLHPNSCSHAVWYVISQYDPSHPYMQANQLIDFLAVNSRWQAVRAEELSKLANEGTLIVGGLKTSPNGHVIVVYPGPAKPAGDYQYTDAAKKIQRLGPKGSYARAMSTSMGQWPGARSHGDKTVWDPWGRDDAFAKVKFWKYVGEGGGVV